MTDFLDEFTTQGAVFAAASVLVFALSLAWWWMRVRRTLRAQDRLRARVLVTGSRGKSSTVRLLHAALSGAGISTYAKTTGNRANEITTEGREVPTLRLGSASVVEMIDSAHRAVLPGDGSAPPQVLVEECMGVSPYLIGLVSARMAQPTIVIILNALHDHPEDEGETPEAVAEALWQAVARDTELVITAEPSDTTFARLAALAGRDGVPLIRVGPADAPAAMITAVPDAHPANLAAVLAVTRHLGVPDDVATRGAATTIRDDIDNRDLVATGAGEPRAFLDLGSINDIESATLAMNAAGAYRDDGLTLIAVLANRWDRPYRALEFAALMSPDDWNGVVIAGDVVAPTRRVLLE